MTDITANPAASGDDGYVRVDTQAFQDALEYATFGNESSVPNLHSFLRFANVAIPAGALITSAVITFTAAQNATGTTVNTLIHYVDEDNPAAPTTYSEWAADSLSASYVAWSPAAWSTGVTYDTPSLVDLIQEIVCRSGWSSGNAMLFNVLDNSSDSGAFRKFRSYDYSGGSAKAELAVTYTANNYYGEVLESAEAAEEVVHNWPGIDESIESADTLSSLLEAIDTIEESGDLAEALGLVFLKTIEDSLSGADAITETSIMLTKTLEDSLDSTDSALAIRHIYKTLTEAIFAWDYAQGQWCQVMEESIVATDEITAILIIQVLEKLFSRDTIETTWNGTNSVETSAVIYDAASWIRVFEKTITESIVSTDTVTLALVLSIAEYFFARDTATAQGSLNRSISESIVAVDSAVSQWLMTILETIDGADAVSLIEIVTATISESITLVDVLSSTGTFNLSASETLQAVDYIENAYNLSISESIVVTDSVPVSFATLYSAVSESLVGADALTVTLEAYLSVSENAVLVDASSNTGAFYTTVQEAIAMNVTVELDGEVYECWVLNTPNFYPSVYSGFNFNSYTVFNNRAFAANSTGIFELTGSTDDGSDIHPGVMLHNTDFGTSQKKRIRRGYLGVSGDNAVMIMQETDTDTRRVYNIDSKGIVKAARDVAGKKWKLSVADFTTLESIKLVPVVLARGR